MLCFRHSDGVEHMFIWSCIAVGDPYLKINGCLMLGPSSRTKSSRLSQFMLSRRSHSCLSVSRHTVACQQRLIALDHAMCISIIACTSHQTQCQLRLCPALVSRARITNWSHGQRNCCAFNVTAYALQAGDSEGFAVYKSSNLTHHPKHNIQKIHNGTKRERRGGWPT